MVTYMKNTFHEWSAVGKFDLDKVCDLIVTGRKASEARPDVWVYPFIGDAEQPLRVLDFGCGFGRNALGIASKHDKWSVVGYDNEAMLSRVNEFAAIHYGGVIPPNLTFTSDWEKLKTETFDCIACIIVLQHIYEDALAVYANDFKKMTKRLFITGRRFNDDKNNRSTWTILGEQGLVPDKFYAGHIEIPYKPDGDPGEHNIALYFL